MVVKWLEQNLLEEYNTGLLIVEGKITINDNTGYSNINAVAPYGFFVMNAK